LTPDEVAKQRAAKLKMKGLMLADTNLAGLMDEQAESGNSDLLPFGIKKDGTFTSYSSVATPDQFAALQQHVRDTVQQLSARMIEGEIRIAPYAQGTYMACDTCSYKPVCQFDVLLEGNEPRQMGKWKDQQVWEMLQGQNGAISQEGGDGDGQFTR
ncbi:PD-(D/E)XK nuclease family protein, partial [Microbacteriaceae bacterium K1510]|nr:PD-(D/E)XK nuclease family protein [Microbacteriaceae bacterium K1510]